VPPVPRPYGPLRKPDSAVKEDAPGWLVQEVSDLLDVSSVGLYEFIWLLRGAYLDAPEAQLRSWRFSGGGRTLSGDSDAPALG
jgi:hypothetical protein